MLRKFLLLCLLAGVVACSGTPARHSPDQDLGILWVNYAAEFRAVSLQVYSHAELDLPGFIADTSWSALPGQEDAGHLPPAVIIDVDETAVSNARYQIGRYPHSDRKLYDWSNEQPADPVPGFRQFADAALEAGVTLFFVTNKPCLTIEGVDDACPYEAATIAELREAGVETDREHVLMAGERPEWTKEKLTRREFVARTHRVIMLIGDDLTDFIPCTRPSPAAPCTAPAGRDARERLTYEHADYWGRGWYILPNPMHGSWTVAR
jgi:acid phosphatase